MPLDIETVRLEIARRHNLLLGKDDPILATVTLNELVIGHFLDRAETGAAETERRGAQRMAQEVAAVKSAAETLIGGASRYIADEVRKAADDGRRAILQEFDQRRAAEQAAARVPGQPVVWVGAACLVVGIAIGALVF